MTLGEWISDMIGQGFMWPAGSAHIYIPHAGLGGLGIYVMTRGGVTIMRADVFSSSNVSVERA